MSNELDKKIEALIEVATNAELPVSDEKTSEIRILVDEVCELLEQRRLRPLER